MWECCVLDSAAVDFVVSLFDRHRKHDCDGLTLYHKQSVHNMYQRQQAV